MDISIFNTSTMAAMSIKSDEWQSDAFRMSMVKKLEEALQEHGLLGQKDPQQMEQTIFMRAKTGEEYLNCSARFILMIQNYRNNAQGGYNVCPSGSSVLQQDQVRVYLICYGAQTQYFFFCRSTLSRICFYIPCL